MRSEAPVSRRLQSAHGRSTRSTDARTHPLPGAFTRGPASVSHKGEKAGTKHNIKKTKIMANGLITSWQIEEEKVEAPTDYFLGPQNHMGGDCRQ